MHFRRRLAPRSFPGNRVATSCPQSSARWLCTFSSSHSLLMEAQAPHLAFTASACLTRSPSDLGQYLTVRWFPCLTVPLPLAPFTPTNLTSPSTFKTTCFQKHHSSSHNIIVFLSSESAPSSLIAPITSVLPWVTHLCALVPSPCPGQQASISVW